MPIDALHKRKLGKNLAVLAMVFGFCALIWAVTIVRLTGNIEQQQTSSPAVTDTVK
jgi:hypothetical protein